MTIGEKLLNLTAEYAAAVDAESYAHLGGVSALRAPVDIAAEYEDALRSLLVPIAAG